MDETDNSGVAELAIEACDVLDYYAELLREVHTAPPNHDDWTGNDGAKLEHDALRELSVALRAAVAVEWRAMVYAPHEGDIALLVHHRDRRFCKTDEERAKREEIVRARWVEHNWTWYGIYGDAMGWRPCAPSNADLA